MEWDEECKSTAANEWREISPSNSLPAALVRWIVCTRALSAGEQLSLGKERTTGVGSVQEEGQKEKLKLYW